jgi:hypothetical protein
VALRRRLSDKDKERRLVRRSSSKRKDKENGGATDKSAQVNLIILLPIICCWVAPDTHLAGYPAGGMPDKSKNRITYL